ncbi:hypothetical protein Ae201684P_022189 [Aphanomyces euteiches]|nr:hypothetical protein Ae201684P_022189 [Aphanomyces euteiches]
MNVSITGDLIKEQALAIYETQPSPKKPMHFSSGWLYCFMKRHDLTSRRLHGERASLAKTKLMTVGASSCLKRLVTLRKTFTTWMKVHCFTKEHPTQPSPKQQHKASKKTKRGITVALAANCSGSDKLPLLFIGKAARLDALVTSQPSSCVSFTDSIARHG